MFKDAAARDVAKLMNSVRKLKLLVDHGGEVAALGQ
jgi:hypothetical protein